MKRVFVKAGLANLSVPKKIVLGNSVAAGLDNNPLIPNAAQIQSDVATATQNLTAAKTAAASGSHVAGQALLVAEIEFDRVMRSAMLFVQGAADAASTSEAAREIILSSGFGARKTPESSPVPMVVAAIVAKFTGSIGTIMVSWKHSKYARWYQLYMTTTPADEASWQLITTTSKRKFLATNLANATRFYFRVVAVGTAGASNPTDPASQITTIV